MTMEISCSSLLIRRSGRAPAYGRHAADEEFRAQQEVYALVCGAQLLCTLVADAVMSIIPSAPQAMLSSTQFSNATYWL